MTGRDRRTLAAAGAATLACLAVAWIGGGANSAGGADGGIVMPPHLSMTVWRKIASIDTFNSIAARPIFSPTRRPSAPVAKQALARVKLSPVTVPPRSPADALVAVAIGPERRVAVVRLGSGRTRVLMEGDHVEGWTMAQIAPDHVVLQNGATSALLPFPRLQRLGGLTAFAKVSGIANTSMSRQ
jgi:hypothetical protein